VEKRVKVSSKRLERVRVTTKPLRHLDPQEVAKALGAELVEEGVPKSLLPAPVVRDAKVGGNNGKPKRLRRKPSGARQAEGVRRAGHDSGS
jgi:nucleoid-associated protein YgaU